VPSAGAALCASYRFASAGLPLRACVVARHVPKRQWRAGEVADCFDQQTYRQCFPVELIDRLLPVVGHHIGRMARLYTQSFDRAALRCVAKPRLGSFTSNEIDRNCFPDEERLAAGCWSIAEALPRCL
jgi:hypothetical protein